jgi:hypothetical protein
MFLAKGVYRDCNIDDFINGELPNTGYSIGWDVDFKAKTKEDLFKKIANFHDIKIENIYTEDGRIYIQKYEIPNPRGWNDATEEDMRLWEKGKKELFLVDYVYDLFEKVS